MPGSKGRSHLPSDLDCEFVLLSGFSPGTEDTGRRVMVGKKLRGVSKQLLLSMK